MHFTGTLLLLKYKKCSARMEAILLMQCIIMENTLIKLTFHDETKKRAHDSQIVRAKENLKLSLCKTCDPLGGAISGPRSII